MQNEFPAGFDNGVAGVVAALVADHVVDIPGQNVDNFAFTLVTPLSADDNFDHSLMSFASKILAWVLIFSNKCGGMALSTFSTVRACPPSLSRPSVIPAILI